MTLLLNCTPPRDSMTQLTPSALSNTSGAIHVSKNFITALSSQEGEFDTSTATDAPFNAAASPSPLSVLTPDFGDAASASWPCSRSLVTSFDPMRPLPPTTTIFTIVSFLFGCFETDSQRMTNRSDKTLDCVWC